MFLHKFDILNRNQNGLFQKLLPVCDEIMRRDEIRWFDGTVFNKINEIREDIWKNTRKATPHNIPCESLHPWVSHRLELSLGISRVHPPHRSSGKMTTFELIGLGFITWTFRIWIPNSFIDSRIIKRYQYSTCFTWILYGTGYLPGTG